MIRLLQFADTHLGVENYGRPDPATGLHTRLVDFLRSFDELIDAALREQVDLVIFCGDAYKSRDPNPTHQREFARRIHRLAAAAIPVFLLAGNHDIPNTFGRANTLDIFSTLEVPNVYVGRKPGVYRIETRHGPLQIVALPWVMRNILLSREEHKNRSLAEIENLTLDKLDHILDELTQSLDPEIPAILTAHGAVQGAVYGSERNVMLGQELVLPRAMLQRQNLDYVALGHIHRYQVLAGSPPAVYSGSLDRIDFGEEKETKGFVIAEIEKGTATHHFQALQSTRRFVTIEVKADGAEPMQQVRAAIAAHDIQDAIVRLIIHTTPEKNRLLRDSELHALLEPALKVGVIVHDVERSARLRLGSNTGVEQMTPLQALEKYLAMQQPPRGPERVQKLLEYAQQIVGNRERG